MCREIGSRAKYGESTAVLPEGVPNKRLTSSSAPSAPAVMSAVVPQVPASSPASTTGPAPVLPTCSIDMATMRAIQAILHAEADGAQARVEAQQTAMREAMDKERKAMDKEREAMDNKIRALQVLPLHSDRTDCSLSLSLSLSLSFSLSHSPSFCPSSVLVAVPG